MLELSSPRKNKINLSDYAFELDILCRMALSDCSPAEFEILQEILYQPSRFASKKLARQLNISEEQLKPVLMKLSRGKLLSIQDGTVCTDKERRKYFEFYIQRFEVGFTPNIDLIRSMLKQVPIDILPAWYPIPRSSSNIFDSIIERYLISPHVYERHLAELPNTHPLMHSIMNDLFQSPELSIPSSDIISRYNLSRRDFEEIMLLLEYHFVCFVSYSREDDHWHEFITPIQEWREYMQFTRNASVPLINDESAIQKTHHNEFATIEAMDHLIRQVQAKPLISPSALTRSHGSLHTEQLIQILVQMRLLDDGGFKLRATETANHWQAQNVEQRALLVYRHLCSDPLVRQARHAIRTVLHGHWVRFHDFLQSAVLFSNDPITSGLNRSKGWKYALAHCDVAEQEHVKQSIFGPLCECGVTATGTIEGEDCFAVTPFGQALLEE